MYLFLYLINCEKEMQKQKEIEDSKGKGDTKVEGYAKGLVSINSIMLSRSTIWAKNWKCKSKRKRRN